MYVYLSLHLKKLCYCNICVVSNRIKRQRPASPVPSCVSMKSDRSMHPPPTFSDGGGPSNEEGYVLTSAGVQCYVMKVTWCEEAICTGTQPYYVIIHLYVFVIIIIMFKFGPI